MFKRKSAENYDQASNLEKVAIATAIGGTIVALAIRVSRHIPHQALEMVHGQSDRTAPSQSEDPALNIQHQTVSTEENHL